MLRGITGSTKPKILVAARESPLVSARRSAPRLRNVVAIPTCHSSRDERESQTSKRSGAILVSLKDKETRRQRNTQVFLVFLSVVLLYMYSFPGSRKT